MGHKKLFRFWLNRAMRLRCVVADTFYDIVNHAASGSSLDFLCSLHTLKSVVSFNCSPFATKCVGMGGRLKRWPRNLVACRSAVTRSLINEDSSLAMQQPLAVTSISGLLVQIPRGVIIMPLCYQWLSRTGRV